MLAALAAVGQDERVHRAVADPNLSDAKVAGLFISILSGKLSGDAENFVRVLAQNDRLGLLPEVRTQFEAFKNEREGVIEAEVQSAFELSDAQLNDLVQRLEKKDRPQGARQGQRRPRADRRRESGARRQGYRRLGAGAARCARDSIESLRSSHATQPFRNLGTDQEPDQNLDAGAQMRTQGTVVSGTDGICRIHGLSDVMQGEMLEFPKNTFGLALNLERDSVGA
jgi:hypothetical protein